MCQFFSAIATKDRLYANYGVDGHEDIIVLNELSHLDRGKHKHGLVRLELTPKRPMTLDFDEWTFKVDQDIVPDWFVSDEWHKKMIDYLKDVPSITEDTDILSVPIWFSTAKIEKMVGFASIRLMLDSGRVEVMRDFSQVGKMLDFSQVVVMLDFSQVGEMWDFSRVGKMWGSSRVGKMWGSSRVGEMWGSSQVGEMWGSSQVGEMWDSSQVEEMWDSSQVTNDHRSNKGKT